MRRAWAALVSAWLLLLPALHVGFAVVELPRRLLISAAVAAAPRPATKDELFEIAGAFAKLASDPRIPNAASVYEEAEATLGNAIQKWESGAITAPAIVEEKARLRLGRARARIALNDMVGGTLPEKAAGAVEDFDVAISIMEEDLRQNPDKLMYSEYPDALVKRGLAKEELKNWEGAAKDYTKAIDALRPKDGRADKALRGDATIQEGDGLGMNPLILNFRGNALSQLGRYDEAVEDYREATQIFDNDGEVRQASFSRANEALALFGAGRDREGEKMMQVVVRNDPGVTDAHVALAATYWSQKKIAEAESQWKFACENIDTGCQSYKDLKWVAEIRRWPPSLVASLRSFLQAKPS
ncbi:unnamed protein product [Symbiodinium pilosum]|uniref:Tetratricopeptide repeat protein n=1 Tax=Symbiodinium pilosum TaxID=2952 RepID=A0A812IT32_SYMPI|nr:unnamed protein product [Symbiodinium pilosum]